MSTTRDQSLEEWVGRSEETASLVTARPAEILAATLDRDDPPLRPGDPIPPGWHWLYFHEVVRLADTGYDGHARTGGFMPPVPLPRRMWAGNRMTFERPLHVGERMTRRSTISAVRWREGDSGRLCFVTVRHDIGGEDGVATVEEQDLVYRDVARPGAPPAKPRPAPAAPAWRRVVHPSPVLLFRFSALTMNSHRIHYDRDFAVGEEGYPGLVFHGPLTMVLLVDLFRRSLPAAALARVEVRATAPLYDDRDFEVQGAPGETPGSALLWALTPDGALAMSGQATCA